MTTIGTNTALLIYTDGEPADLLRDEPDPEATRDLIARTNPGWDGATVPPAILTDALWPEDDTVYAASFPGLDILCDQQLMSQRPSTLSRDLLDAGRHRNKVVLHTMYSTVDWFGFAIWEDGSLVRSLSLDPDSGIIEDIGTPLPFEEPYWAGAHPVASSTYPLPFHPLALGEKALWTLLEGEGSDLSKIRLPGFRT